MKSTFFFFFRISTPTKDPIRKFASNINYHMNTVVHVTRQRWGKTRGFRKDQQGVASGYFARLRRKWPWWRAGRCRGRPGNSAACWWEERKLGSRQSLRRPWERLDRTNIPNTVALSVQYRVPAPNKTESPGHKHSSLSLEQRNLGARNGFGTQCFKGFDCFLCFLKLKRMDLIFVV